MSWQRTLQRRWQHLAFRPFKKLNRLDSYHVPAVKKVQLLNFVILIVNSPRVLDRTHCPTPRGPQKIVTECLDHRVPSAEFPTSCELDHIARPRHAIQSFQVEYTKYIQVQYIFRMDFHGHPIKVVFQNLSNHSTANKNGKHEGHLR